MKKIKLLILCVPALLSCGINVNQALFKSGITNICSQPSNYLGNTMPKINVPDFVGNTPAPIKEDFKIIETTDTIYNTDVEALKDNKFVAVYSYINNFVAKIFDKNGEEIVHRFKIADSKNLDTFKIITNKNLDYFFVFYHLNDQQKIASTGYFLKKFDLEGNQFGNEIKLEDNLTDDITGNASFSFDEKNLILSWATLKFDHINKPYSNCLFFQGCAVPAISLPSSYHPVINIIKFDDKLNYCFTRTGLDELIQPNDRTNSFSSPYITKNKDTVLFPISYQNIKEINIKNNSIKTLNLETNSANTNPNQPHIININESNNNFYFSDNSTFYKTDSNFKVIKSNFINTSEIHELDLKTIDDKIQLSPITFVNEQLDIFEYQNSKSPNIGQLKIMKLDKNFLVVDTNYFQLIDNM